MRDPLQLRVEMTFVFYIGFLAYMCQGRKHFDGTVTEGFLWGSEGDVPFRTWITQVHSWINATSSRMTATAQAAAIQRGLRGSARQFAMALPPSAIALGAAVNGTTTDPVTFLLIPLCGRYSETEDERTMTRGMAMLDFQR